MTNKTTTQPRFAGRFAARFAARSWLLAGCWLPGCLAELLLAGSPFEARFAARSWQQPAASQPASHSASQSAS